MSTAQARAKRKYEKKAYDTILIRVYKGRKELIKSHVEKNGTTVNGRFNQLMNEDMKPKATYMAVFTPSQTGYNVFFPDVPGCTAFGVSVVEAKEQAAQALRLHLLALETKGEALPVASKVATIHTDAVPELMVAVVTVFLE